MTEQSPTLVVVGLVYFEVAIPAETLSVAPGKEVFDDRVRAGLGGALNTASVARALGGSVVLAYPSGDGLTDRVAATVVRDLGIPALTWESSPDVAISIVIERDRERSFISRADHECLQRCPPLPPTTHIHVPGLVEARTLEPRLVEAKAAGAKISVSGSWAPEVLDELASRPAPWDVLLLNEPEAVRAAGSVRDAPAALADVSPELVVTLGARGAIGACRGEWFEVPATPTEIHDATGAGDAFAAGYVIRRMHGAGCADAAAFASRVVARQLSVPGGVAMDTALYADLRTNA